MLIRCRLLVVILANVPIAKRAGLRYGQNIYNLRFAFSDVVQQISMIVRSNMS